MNSQLKNLINSGLSSIIVKVISLILNLITIPILFKTLGEYEFGIYSIIVSMSLVLVFSDFGLSNSLVNELGSLSCKRVINKKVNFYFTVLSIISLICITFFTFVYFIWIENYTYSSSFFLYLFFIIITLPFVVIEKYLLAIGKYYIYNLSYLIILIINFILLVTFGLFLDSLDLNLAILLLSTLNLFVLITSYFANNYFYNESSIRLKFVKLKCKYIVIKLTSGLKFFKVQLYSLIINSCDIIIIGSTVGPVIAGKYSIVKKLFNTVQIINFFFKPLWPYCNELLIKKNKQKIKFLFKIGIVSMTIIPLVGSALLLFNIDYIYSIFTDDTFDLEYSLLIGFSLYTIIQGHGGLVSSFMNTKYFLHKQSILLAIAAFFSLVSIVTLSMNGLYPYIPSLLFLIMFSIYIIPSYISLSRHLKKI